jgi:amidase
MTATVADNALMLDVIAGLDGYDPRQYRAPPQVNYTQELTGGVGNMRIGVLQEGFARPESEAESDAKARQGAELFAQLGATVEESRYPNTCLAPRSGRRSARRASHKP